MSVEHEPAGNYDEPKGGLLDFSDIPDIATTSVQEYAQTNGVNPNKVIDDERKAVEMAYASDPYRTGLAAIPEGERYLDKETAARLGLTPHPSLPPQRIDTDLEYEAESAEERAARRVDRGEAALVGLEDGARQMADLEDYYREKIAKAERDSIEGPREGETEEMAHQRQRAASDKLGPVGSLSREWARFEQRAQLPEYGRIPEDEIDVAEAAAHAAKSDIEAAKRINRKVDNAAKNAPDAATTIGAPLIVSALIYGTGKVYAKLRELRGRRKAERVIREANKEDN